MSGRVYCKSLGAGSIPFFLLLLGFMLHGSHSFRMFIFIPLSFMSYWDLFSFLFMWELLIYDVNGRLVDFVALMIGMI
ncbi:hypothetical protein C7212DRAFT_212009 [Tuber magnatum]|uniref:Uncharacterized protein n=1 Tax=Tuber magnatum TaxID=42249 RepID=A0A317SIN7_9PEZI|nr:hypothetical protein C7212DRAFT_212009 [Tuber magnatum]